MNSKSLKIGDRFCGPPNSGNGGFVCGLLARHLPGTVTARLKLPPPLNTALRCEWDGESARLFHEATLVGEARRSDLRPEAPPCPSLSQARVAAEHFLGFKQHLFPRCFVCGPDRAPGDGLRIFASPLHGQTLHAAPWIPDPSLADDQGQVAMEFVWAALDCPSGFAVLPLPEGQAIVLGELSALITSSLPVGEPAVVSSWPMAYEGRRRITGTAIHRADGALVAAARAVWVEVSHKQWAAAA